MHVGIPCDIHELLLDVLARHWVTQWYLMAEEPTEHIDSAIRGFQRYTVIEGLSNHTILCAVFLSMLQLSYSLNLLRTKTSVVVKVAIPIHINFYPWTLALHSYVVMYIGTQRLCSYVHI